MKNILTIDHINILAKDLNTTVNFYNKIFGLVYGATFAGGKSNYLYAADRQHAPIHLETEQRKIEKNQRQEPGFRVHAVANAEHTGALDHVAFVTDQTSFEAILAALKAENIDYTMAASHKQMWFFDPNKVKLEVSY